MKFFINKNKFNDNKIIINTDNSFCCNKSEAWDYQLMLDNIGQFILNFDRYTHRCVSCEGFILKTKHIELRELSVPTSEKGELCVKDLPDSIGDVYKQLKKYLYLDKEHSLFAIGDIFTKNKYYEFGSGQYVALSDEGDIVCVLVKFYT